MEKVLDAIADLSKHVDKRIDDVGKQVDERCRMLSQKLDDVKDTQAVFREKTGERIAGIEAKEATCPIHKLNGQIKDVRDKADTALEKANSAKRLAVIIATALSVVFSGLVNSIFEFIGFPKH